MVALMPGSTITIEYSMLNNSGCRVNRLTYSVLILILRESRGVIMIEHSASPSRACSNEYLWLTGTDKPQCTCTATRVQLQKL